ncbi:hypothetical protein TAMA11512_09300 [Selenomonas sp. TAMA-11512]|uniref:N-acetylmuramoyl-L-alanine amidase family protein n=1 Tax=Selenomonas sp. TAMA-11512 TaxID=3095337 RepID=UPI00308CFE02|nr:hypothetical protein TAMA11512_09300 [Selenomonas sp. TAMA-11512]
MKVFLNPGHAPNGIPDPGACGCGLRECDVAKSVADLVEHYLTAAGVEVVGNMQDDDLYTITSVANASEADVFISIHCNAFNGNAKGTEVLVYPGSAAGRKLGNCIQRQIVDSMGTTDRGLKDRPNLWVLKHTDMPAVLVELAFIDNAGDAVLLRDRQDDFARAIARGVTDYELI